MEAEHPQHLAPPLFEPFIISTTDDEMLDSTPDQRRDEDFDIDLDEADIYNGVTADSDTNVAMEEDQSHNDDDQLMLDEDEDEIEIMYEPEPAQDTQQTAVVLEDATAYQSTEEIPTQVIEQPLDFFAETSAPDNDEKLDSDPITKPSPTAQSPHAPEIETQEHVAAETEPINEPVASENVSDDQTREPPPPQATVEEHDGDVHPGNSWSENTSTTLGNEPPFEELRQIQNPDGDSKRQSEPDNEYDNAGTGRDEPEAELFAPHPVIVYYDTNRVCLFPPPAHFVDGSATSPNELPSEYFIEDPAFCTKELALLFAKIRDVLQDTINPAHELVISIEELDLEFCEDGIPPSPISFIQILDLYVQLYQQDGIEHPPALQMTLMSRPSVWRHFQLLFQCSENGMGLTEALEKCGISRTADSRVSRQEDDVEDDYQQAQGATSHEHVCTGAEVTDALGSDNHSEKEDEGAVKEEARPGDMKSNNVIDETIAGDEHVVEDETEKGPEEEEEEDDDDFDLEYEEGNDAVEKGDDGKSDVQDLGGQPKHEDDEQANPNIQPASEQLTPPVDNTTTSVASEAGAGVEIEEVEEESKSPHQLYQPDEVLDVASVAQTAASTLEEEEDDEELLEYEDVEGTPSYLETDRLSDRFDENARDIYSPPQDLDQPSEHNAQPTPPTAVQVEGNGQHETSPQSPNTDQSSESAKKLDKSSKQQTEPIQEAEFDESKPASIPVIGVDNVEDEGEYADYQAFDGYDYEEEQYAEGDHPETGNHFTDNGVYHGENGDEFHENYSEEHYDENYQGDEQYPYNEEIPENGGFPEFEPFTPVRYLDQYEPQSPLPEQDHHEAGRPADGPLDQFGDNADTIVATDAIDPMHKPQQFNVEETYEYEEVVETHDVAIDKSPAQKRQRDHVDQEEGGEVDEIQAVKRVRST
ncbi:hypothetical protein RUND412_003796 [Rhizina undulata]